jgi:hypothetical protein
MGEPNFLELEKNDQAQEKIDKLRQQRFVEE